MHKYFVTFFKIETKVLIALTALHGQLERFFFRKIDKIVEKNFIYIFFIPSQNAQMLSTKNTYSYPKIKNQITCLNSFWNNLDCCLSMSQDRNISRATHPKLANLAIFKPS